MDKLIILDHATMAAPIVPLSEWMRDNADDEDLVAAVEALPYGTGLTVGGGAAPAFSITKVRA